MPIIKSAKKKLKQDIVRTKRNLVTRTEYKKAIKAAKDNPTKKAVQDAYSEIDKAAKTNVIHKNKADRLKKQVANYAKG